MKILILSCNMGEGHNTAGRAVYEKFRQMGVECDFEDALAKAEQLIADGGMSATSSRKMPDSVMPCSSS